jgi:hypothetical protein
LRSQLRPELLFPGDVRLWPSLRPRSLAFDPDGCWSCGAALSPSWCGRVCHSCRSAYKEAEILPTLLIAPLAADDPFPVTMTDALGVLRDI